MHEAKLSELTSIDGLDQLLLSFSSDSLQQHALVQIPVTEPPPAGWPVIIFNHGFVPEPKRYGLRSSDDVSDRPGDYYRLVPQSYARHGFIVISPDYRGHNNSEGYEFTGKPL